MPRDFPEIRDGDPIEPWHLNIVYRELRRLRKMRGGGTITVQNADGTLPPLIVQGGFSIAAIGVASGTIGPYSSGCGTGSFTIQDVSDTGSLSNGGEPLQPCFNLLDKTIATGARLTALRVNESWFVVAVGSCSNLS